MIESGYNEPAPSLNDLYGDKANKLINNEIDEFTSTYEEYILEYEDSLPEENIDNVKCWYDDLSDDKKKSIKDKYYKYRIDDVLETLSIYAEPDYDLRDEIRERYL